MSENMKILSIEWLIIIYGFTSRWKIFHLYGDVTIAGEGLQNLGLCSALRAFQQGGIFVVLHLLWHGTSVFTVSSEGPPHLVASSGGLLVPEGLYSPVAKYFSTWFKIRIWIELSRKNVNFVNSSQNEGLSPSGIALSFDGFVSISWHPVWFSSDSSFNFLIFVLGFQLFWPEHHWRDFSCWNAHLVHQNC
jgi:hypothetical protein